MDDAARLEAEILALQRALAAVEARLGRLEAARGVEVPPPRAVVSGEAPARVAEEATAAPSPAPTQVRASDMLATVPLAGRLTLVLAGAYLVRAFTEGGTLPQAVGVSLGFVYALFWVFATHRAGAAGNRLSATFHGVGATLIAYPLIWETTTQFGYLTPTVSALALGAVTTVALLVAARHGLRVLAWVFWAGSAASTALLLPRTGSAVPFTALTVVLGVLVLWLSRARSWPVLPWAAAFVADAAAFFLTEKAIESKTDAIDPTIALLLLLGLVVAYLASFGWASLSRGRSLDLIDVVQTAGVLLVGLWGAFRVSAAKDQWTLALGLLGLLGALLYYLVAFRLLSRARRGYFFYFSTVGLVLLLLGSDVVIGQPALPWAALALASAWLGSHFGRVTLSLHAAVYAWAAAIASGLVDEAWHAWTGSATVPWPGVGVLCVVSLATAAVCAWLPIRGDTPYWKHMAIAPKLALITLLLFGGGAVLLEVLIPLLTAAPGHGASTAVVATLRTAVLAVLVLLCTLWRRSARLGAAIWLVYPLLVLGALKLLVEDMAAGTAATLWISLLCYGLALILGPRLAKGRTAPMPDGGGAPAP